MGRTTAGQSSRSQHRAVLNERSFGTYTISNPVPLVVAAETEAELPSAGPTGGGFTTSDAEHTFEGLVRFFEAPVACPGWPAPTAMGARGRSQGKRFRLHPAAVDFARHHGTEIKACQAGDASARA